MTQTDTSSDLSLLREFTASRSEAAFGAIVERHAPWLFAAALRQLRDAHLAEDAVQTVFIILAQKAHRMHNTQKLSGWLFNTLYFTIKAIRRNRLRQEKREQQAGAQQSAFTTDDAPNEDLLVHLDLVVGRLPELDRNAILLRFYQNRPFAEVGAALNTTEDAARQRVTRALARLRKSLARHALSLTDSSLALAALHGLRQTPPALIQTVAHAALHTSTLPAPSVATLKGATTLMAISKFKTAAMALLSLFLCTGVAVIAIKSIPSPAAADIVANATVPISAPAAVESNWPVTFSDGTTVELLGIHDEPAPAGDVAEALGLSSTSQPAATPWWLPDGSEFPAPLHEDRPRIHMSPVPKGHRLLRFILTMPAAAARRTGITVNVLPSTRCGVSSYGNGGPRWIEVVAIVPAAAKTADLRIGLANGPWTDDITYDVATKQFTKSPTAEATINKIDVTDENGEACVTVYGQEHERPTRDSQIVAMAGNRRLQIQHGRGDFAAMHNYYRASADQITEVILQSRPFEYMAIKNVSLSPTKTPTKVEVVPLADSPAPK